MITMLKIGQQVYYRKEDDKVGTATIFAIPVSEKEETIWLEDEGNFFKTHFNKVFTNKGNNDANIGLETKYGMEYCKLLGVSIDDSNALVLVENNNDPVIVSTGESEKIVLRTVKTVPLSHLFYIEKSALIKINKE